MKSWRKLKGSVSRSKKDDSKKSGSFSSTSNQSSGEFNISNPQLVTDPVSRFQPRSFEYYLNNSNSNVISHPQAGTLFQNHDNSKEFAVNGDRSSNSLSKTNPEVRIDGSVKLNDDSMDDEFKQGMKELHEMRIKYEGMLKVAATTQQSAAEFSKASKKMSMYMFDAFGSCEEKSISKLYKNISSLQFDLAELIELYGKELSKYVSIPTENFLTELSEIEETRKVYNEKIVVYNLFLQDSAFSNSENDEISKNAKSIKDEFDEIAMTLGCRLLAFKKNKSKHLLSQAVCLNSSQMKLFKKGLKRLRSVEKIFHRYAKEGSVDMDITPESSDKEDDISEGDDDDDDDDEEVDDDDDDDDDEEDNSDAKKNDDPKSEMSNQETIPMMPIEKVSRLRSQNSLKSRSSQPGFEEVKLPPGVEINSQNCEDDEQENKEQRNHYANIQMPHIGYHPQRSNTYHASPEFHRAFVLPTAANMPSSRTKQGSFSAPLGSDGMPIGYFSPIVENSIPKSSKPHPIDKRFSSFTGYSSPSGLPTAFPVPLNSERSTSNPSYLVTSPSSSPPRNHHTPSPSFASFANLSPLHASAAPTSSGQNLDFDPLVRGMAGPSLHSLSSSSPAASPLPSVSEKKTMPVNLPDPHPPFPASPSPARIFSSAMPTAGHPPDTMLEKNPPNYPNNISPSTSSRFSSMAPNSPNLGNNKVKYYSALQTSKSGYISKPASSPRYYSGPITPTGNNLMNHANLPPLGSPSSPSLRKPTHVLNSSASDDEGPFAFPHGNILNRDQASHSKLNSMRASIHELPKFVRQGDQNMHQGNDSSGGSQHYQAFANPLTRTTSVHANFSSAFSPPKVSELHKLPPPPLNSNPKELTSYVSQSAPVLSENARTSNLTQNAKAQGSNTSKRYPLPDADATQPSAHPSSRPLASSTLHPNPKSESRKSFSRESLMNRQSELSPLPLPPDFSASSSSNSNSTSSSSANPGSTANSRVSHSSNSFLSGNSSALPLFSLPTPPPSGAAEPSVNASKNDPAASSRRDPNQVLRNAQTNVNPHPLRRNISLNSENALPRVVGSGAERYQYAMSQGKNQFPVKQFVSHSGPIIRTIQRNAVHSP